MINQDLNNKNYTVFILKIIATVLVVMVHGGNIFQYGGTGRPNCFHALYQLAATGVPIFFTVSGYLFFRKETDFKSNLNKKTKRLAVPLLVWNVFWMLFELVGHLVMPSNFEDVLSWNATQIIGFLGIPFYSTTFYAPLWYVRDLYLISIIAPLFRKHLQRFPVVFLLIAIFIWFLPVNSYFRLTFTYFIWGGVIATCPKMIERLNRLNVMQGIVLFVFGCVLSYFQSEVLNRMIILLFLLAIYAFSHKLKSNEQIRKVSAVLVSYSFMIYVLHGKILSSVQIIYVSVFNSKAWLNFGYFFIPFFVIILCIGLAVAFKRISPTLYGICTGET